MAKEKQSFVFYESFYLAIETLSDAEQLQLFKAITRRALYGEKSELSGCAKGMFSLIEPQLIANEKRYANSLKGGAPKGNSNACKSEKSTEKQPKNNQNSTKKQPNVNDNDNVNENVNVNDNDYDNVNDYDLPVSDEPKAEKQTKHKYGTYKNVLLTDRDIENLKQKFPNDYQEKIENLSEGIELKGYKYKNHYLAILKWEQNRKEEPKNNFAGYDIEKFEEMLYRDD